MRLFPVSVFRNESSEVLPRLRGTFVRNKTIIGFVAVALALVGIAARGGAEPVSQAAKSAGTGSGDAAAGKQVFAAQGCFKCHGAAGEGLKQSEIKTAGPRIGPTKRSLAAFISFVRAPAGDVMMPYDSSTVSDADLANVYAFLQAMATSPDAATVSASLATPAGSADNGKRLFESYGCYECHGHMAEGGSAGLRLAPNPMAFEALVKYVRHPTGQMPPYTGKVVSDSELADIYAFLQSIPPAPKAENIPLLR